MKEEALALVDELNEIALDHSDLEYYLPFEFKSYGWNNSAIYFMGVVLWTEDNDEREYIGDSDIQESLRDYVVRESNIILHDLSNKIKHL